MARAKKRRNSIPNRSPKAKWEKALRVQITLFVYSKSVDSNGYTTHIRFNIPFARGGLIQKKVWRECGAELRRRAEHLFDQARETLLNARKQGAGMCYENIIGLSVGKRAGHWPLRPLISWFESEIKKGCWWLVFDQARGGSFPDSPIAVIHYRVRGKPMSYELYLNARYTL